VKIVIATPLWPPEIGGPAQYAANLSREFEAKGHEVVVVKFNEVRRWPSGLRHLLYFAKIWRALWGADWCLALDTFSVALPSVLAGKLLGKKVLIRTGGDFLWENYVERTGDLVLLRDFYLTRLGKLNFKERLVFSLSRWVVRHAALLVFSTEWQRQIWLKPYGLELGRTKMVENYYG
jgi:glycosyltransferase involved in cell wall biosynthesis